MSDMLLEQLRGLAVAQFALIERQKLPLSTDKHIFVLQDSGLLSALSKPCTLSTSRLFSVAIAQCCAKTKHQGNLLRVLLGSPTSLSSFLTPSHNDGTNSSTFAVPLLSLNKPLRRCYLLVMKTLVPVVGYLLTDSSSSTV